MQNDELKPCPFCGGPVATNYPPSIWEPGSGGADQSMMSVRCLAGCCYTITKGSDEAIAAWNHRADANTITALQAEVERLREALEDATETLSSVEIPSLLDPFHTPEIRALGERIGYGALMHGASALWRHKLEIEGGSGGEFVVGPCQKTITNAWMKARKALENRHE